MKDVTPTHALLSLDRLVLQSIEPIKGSRTSLSAFKLVLVIFCMVAVQLDASATTCAGATVINPASLPITNQALVCGATNDLNSTNVPGALCGTGDNAGYKNGNEALYAFTPTTTGPRTITVNGQIWSAIMVYAGCPNTGGTCIYGDGNGPATTTITVTMNAGTQYYIWFDTWPTPNSPCPGTFSMAAPPPPPANDNPCGATPLPVNGTCVYQTSTTASATATAGIPAPGCGNYVTSDVWFSVVVPASGRVIIDSNTGVITDSGMALYTAPACGGAFTLVECDDDDSPNGLMSFIDRPGLVPGSTVYIRFWEYGGDNNGTFSICASLPPAPPTNDNPCSATALPVNTSCVNTAGNTAGSTATTGPPAPTCASYNGFDVWYSIVVPASGSVILESTAGTLTDGGMAVYTATACNGTFTQIACDDDSGPGLMPMITLNGLAVGSTIYVRFWEYGGDNNGTFSICARIPPPPPTGDCVYALNLFDSFGDGWGTSQVGVSINGGANTWYTVGGSAFQVLLGMNIGDVIVLTYNATGTFQAENSYALGIWNGGVYFNSGSPPASGVSFAQSVDCAPPPAAPQDCAGGTTLCSGQSFNNNSTNTGNVNDLNTSNQGCLGGGEQQGTWYYFSPSAAGTLELTITPSTSTDYDFAIWGPQTTVTCPPPGAPLRCSWAYPPNVPGYPTPAAFRTGMATGNSDVSEGAGFPGPPVNGFVAPIVVGAAQVGMVYTLYVDNFDASGQSFQFDWTLTNGASLDCTVLPVEMLDLHATPHDRSVMLNWGTVSESNNAYFSVQRSVDGRSFGTIGSVSGAGTSNGLIEYAFNDVDPTIGVNYYRLVQVDLDGREKTSNTVTALFRNRAGTPVVVPNPMSDNAIVHFDGSLYEQLDIQILDSGGRIVMNRTLSLSPGIKQFEISMSGFDAGAYVLAISSREGSDVMRTRFVKH